MKTLQIPIPIEECEIIKAKCSQCIHKNICDYYWVSNLWENHNKIYKDDSLLGPCIPISVKSQIRSGKCISITGKYDFCFYNNPKNRPYVVIYDIYVDEIIRGQHIGTQIITELSNRYGKPIFAKCVRGSSAEDFWKHVGIQLNANENNPFINDYYEHRPNKRDLGWYLVENKKLSSYNIFE